GSAVPRPPHRPWVPGRRRCARRRGGACGGAEGGGGAQGRRGRDRRRGTRVGVRVAALYDVHGNVAALEAVLAEVGEEAPEVVVFGGDLVWGPWPSECLALAEGFGDRAVPLR